MTDIDGLKQRINLVDLRLQTAHSARERESVSLMEMWEEMRERYALQHETVIDLRAQVAALEARRDELTVLINSLLEAVETGMERLEDETVPHIREMAGELLGTTPVLDEEDVAEDDGEDGLELVLEDEVDEDEEYEEETDAKPAQMAQPLQNEGIRELISRVEEAVQEDFAAPPEISPEDRDEDLIALRQELERLRQRSMAASA